MAISSLVQPRVRSAIATRGTASATASERVDHGLADVHEHGIEGQEEEDEEALDDHQSEEQGHPRLDA